MTNQPKRCETCWGVKDEPRPLPRLPTKQARFPCPDAFHDTEASEPKGEGRLLPPHRSGGGDLSGRPPDDTPASEPIPCSDCVDRIEHGTFGWVGPCGVCGWPERGEVGPE